MAMNPALAAVRLRLLEDFAFYAASALKIRTKAGKIEPLVLNEAQLILLDAIEKQLQETGRIRIVVLKARQQGLSTIIGAYLYWRTSQRKARKALVVAHKADSTKTLFDMTQRYHDQCPEILRPHTAYSSRKELVFDILDSSYAVATAGGDSIGRSETISDAHLSELAFWPKATAAENLNGVLQAIPNEPGTCVIVESTANGVSGLYADLWRGAVDGSNGFIAVFIPWFKTKEYWIPVKAPLEHTPEETKLIRLFGLDDEQLNFRRQKIATNGPDAFQQEYPATALEAFLTTGRPVFIPKQVEDFLEACKPPVARLGLEGDTWEKHPRGELLTYAPHDDQETYVIGADVGMGVRRDWSVAQVIDGSGQQVATYRAQVDPDFFATILDKLGRFYNEAKIIVESNNHGILTCARLGKDMAYPNFYTEVNYDKITDTYTERLGFNTNVKSKPLIIDKLRAALRQNEIVVNDKQTLTEMRSYIVTEEGKMEAEAGCHDDTVMALALAHYIFEGRPEIVENQPDWYCRMD